MPRKEFRLRVVLLFVVLAVVGLVAVKFAAHAQDVNTPSRERRTGISVPASEAGPVDSFASPIPDVLSAPALTSQIFYRINQGQFGEIQFGNINIDGSARNTIYFGGGNTSKPPPDTTGAGNETTVAVDTAAGFSFTVGIGKSTGASNSYDAFSVHNIRTGALIETVEFGPNTGSALTDDVVQAVTINPITHTVYVGDWGTDLAHTGIAVFTYNPSTGIVTPSSTGTGSTQITTTIGASSTVTTPSGIYLFTESQVSGYQNTNAFYLDRQNNKLYYVNDNSGYNIAPYTPTNAVYVVGTTGPFAATQLTSNGAGVGQFPTANQSLSGHDQFIGPNGSLVGVTVDVADGIVFFESTDNIGSANNALWWVSASGGANQTATKVTLPAGVTLSFAGQSSEGGTGAGLSFDPTLKQIYLTDAVNSATTPNLGHLYVLQWNNAAKTVSLVTSFDTATLANKTPATVTSEDAISATALDILPTLTTSATATHATEQSATNLTLLSATPSVTDVDGDHLAGATVQITSGTFATSDTSAADDHLTIDPAHRVGGGTNTSGTVSGTGITYSYTSATETLTLTGYDTLANYQSVLSFVQYFTTGDNPTNYGNNTTRTITWQANDGAIGNPGGVNNVKTTTLNIDAVNDAPVNNLPTPPTTINEDTLTTVSGVTISDVDADPANQTITTTWSVTNGTLTLNTAVAGGIVSGDITGGANGTASVTITATQNKINNTLVNGTGLRYKGAQDYFGTETLHIVTNDSGHTGSPGAQSDTDDLTFTVNPVNDLPSFTKGADQTVLEDAGVQTVNGWATNLSAGPANESSQTLNFPVSNNNNALFSVQPAISATGNLTYTPAANANGTALVTVQIHDSGGTANGGVDTSASQTFNINVTAVNDAPSFTKGPDKTVLEEAGVQTFAAWATGISAGPADENSQTVNFIVTNDNNGLFSAQPAVASNGTLTFTPAANANGSTTVTISLHDNGGTANGGADTSAQQTFTINVTAVNDVPSFTKGADQTNIIAGSGAKTVPGWATNLSAGPANESGQTLSFIVGNNNNSLFSAQPAVDSSGQLTYTPAIGVTGSATVQVQIHDNGGTANGGVDTSAIQTFNISVTNTVVWSGAVSSDWNTLGNWTQSFVPISSNDVSIPTAGVTNQPNLSAQDTTVNNITIASSRSLTISGGHMLTVNGILTMNGNDIDATNGTLVISGTGSVTRTSGAVIGPVQKLFGGPGAFTYPVGTAGAFSPVDVNVTAGTGSLSVKANTGTAPSTPALTAANTLQRFWDLNGSGITADVTWHYLQTDVAGTEANYKVVRVIPGPGTPVTVPNGAPCPGTGSPCVDTTANTIFVRGLQNFSLWTATALAPTAAKVTLSGRVIRPDGLMAVRSLVSITDDHGNVLYAKTNPFGYFRFLDVESGQGYLINVIDKQFEFAPQFVSVTDNMGDLVLALQPRP